MRVRRSTVEEVRARILARKKKPEPKIDPLERIEARQKDLEAKRLQRLVQRRREKEKLKSANDDSEMAMLMGFGGFGTSKSN